MFEESGDTFESEISTDRHARSTGFFVERDLTHGVREQIITRSPQVIEHLTLDWMSSHLHEKEFGAIWRAAFDLAPAPNWLRETEQQVEGMATGQQRRIVLQVLREAARIPVEEPLVESTPNGGIAVTVKSRNDILTVLVENEIGMVVRTGTHFIIRCDYDLQSSPRGEFLTRCSQELGALHRVE